MTAYPMLDNVVQGNVVNIGSKFLPSVLNGSESIAKALQAMQTTLQQLPASQRGNTFP
jgi:raffinose/stachyose/melibiose transport system substrate-binding protein